MAAEITHPAIVDGVMRTLAKTPSLKALVADRIYTADPDGEQAGPYLVVTPDRATPPHEAKRLQQSLVNVKSVAAEQDTLHVCTLAVQRALSGKVFDPVHTAVMHDTSRESVTAAGWHSRTDLYACFHSPSVVADGAVMASTTTGKSDAETIAELRAKLAAFEGEQEPESTVKAAQ